MLQQSKASTASLLLYQGHAQYAHVLHDSQQGAGVLRTRTSGMKAQLQGLLLCHRLVWNSRVGHFPVWQCFHLAAACEGWLTQAFPLGPCHDPLSKHHKDLLVLNTVSEVVTAANTFRGFGALAVTTTAGRARRG